MKRRPWSIWRILAAAPLPMALLILAWCAWIFVSDTVASPRWIDGQPDDAPRRASLILGSLIVIVYMAYLGFLGLVRAILWLFRARPPELPQTPRTSVDRAGNAAGRPAGRAHRAARD